MKKNILETGSNALDFKIRGFLLLKIILLGGKLLCGQQKKK
jgi:hypothetical protein